MKPRLFLANFASRQTPGCHGPGPLYTIMAAPRAHYGECGQGRVSALVPPLQALLEVKRAQKASPRDPEAMRAFLGAVETYRGIFSDHMAKQRHLGPGELLAWIPRVGGARGEESAVEVVDGSTLACACSRAAAAKGECHRAIAVPFLQAAGWDVRLDGRPIP